MIANVEGFGYDIVYVGSDPKKMTEDGAKRDYDTLFDFFDNINESEGYTSIARKKRGDQEYLGCGAYEVIRAKTKKIFGIYHMPMLDVRICSYNPDIDVPVTISVPLRRNGSVKMVKVEKKFRRFCQIIPWTNEARYFKEFGDPRIMDYTTGRFDPSTKKIATELWFMPLPFGGDTAYGMPRWSGAILDAKGRSASQFINYDLMDSQGIPPMAVMVTGGLLTDESWNDLNTILTSAKGRANFNKVLLMEAIPELSGLDEKGSVKLEFKNLADLRKEDLMFGAYQDKALENTRRGFRLPPLYTGDARSYNLASARSSQLISEQQIFGPERTLVDDEINRLIVNREFGIYDWNFRSKGPRIVGSEEQALAVEKFSKVGALTINDAINIANEAFGLNMATHNEPWAKLPLVMLEKMVDKFMTNAAASELISIQDNGMPTMDDSTTTPTVE